MDINQIIKERRSTFPKEFNGEVIDDSVIEQLLENAQWATVASQHLCLDFPRIFWRK